MARKGLLGCGIGAGTGSRTDSDGDLRSAGRAAGERGGTRGHAARDEAPGTTTRVQTELKAKGLYRPGLPPGDGSGEAKMPKPLSVEIETRFVFDRTNGRDRSQRTAGTVRARAGLILPPP